MDRLDATIEVNGHRFPFALHVRPLVLGDAGEVAYYWMNSQDFRRRPPGPNFRACVDLWWAAVEEAGATADVCNLVNRVWAECYPLFSTARSLQDVYLDAMLAPGARGAHDKAGRHETRDGQTASLRAEEANRLRELARRRDTRAVRAALEAFFLGGQPTEVELPACQERARTWLLEGIRALEGGGPAGLATHVERLAPTVERIRKRGGKEQDRRILNWFAYESKVAFYLCHAGAWAALIPWLRRHRGLDAVSERFLRLWHHQNQPGDVPDAGPGGNRDAFCGQVLSLHPLSAFIMNDPAHLRAVGRWMAHPDHEHLVASGQVGSCEAYWDLVATILIAADEYRLTRESWERPASAGVRTDRTSNPAEAARDDSPCPVARELEDYAAGRGIACRGCGGELRYEGHLADEGDEASVVRYRCRDCEGPFETTIRCRDFEDWLRPDA